MSQKVDFRLRQSRGVEIFPKEAVLMQYRLPRENFNRESFRVAQNQFLRHVRYNPYEKTSSILLLGPAFLGS